MSVLNFCQNCFPMMHNESASTMAPNPLMKLSYAYIKTSEVEFHGVSHLPK